MKKQFILVSLPFPSREKAIEWARRMPQLTKHGSVLFTGRYNKSKKPGKMDISEFHVMRTISKYDREVKRFTVFIGGIETDVTAFDYFNGSRGTGSQIIDDAYEIEIVHNLTENELLRARR